MKWKHTFRALLFAAGIMLAQAFAGAVDGMDTTSIKHSVLNNDQGFNEIKVADASVAVIDSATGAYGDFVVYGFWGADPFIMEKVSHIHIGWNGFDAAGNITSAPSGWIDSVDYYHQYGVKAIMGFDSHYPWGEMMNNANGSRDNFVTQLTQFLIDSGADGVDFDNENGPFGSVYDALIIDCANAFSPYGFTVGADVYYREELTSVGLAAIDHLNLMAYCNLSWDINIITYWQNRGAVDSTINLGMPNGWAGGCDSDDYGFNPEVAAEKTQYAIDNGLGGVMIFRTDLDTLDPATSLVQAISDTIRDNFPSRREPDLRWRFDEGSGAIVANQGDHNRDGLFRNMDDSAWAQGLTGPALQFDGLDDFVAVVGYRGILGRQSRTLAAWINTASPGIIAGWGKVGTPGAKWLFQIENDGRLRLAVGQGWAVGTTDLRDNAWHHVAAVLQDDGSPNISEVNLYVDGEPEPITDSSSREIYTLGAINNAKIGWLNETEDYFHGMIDDVRIWNYALAGGQIKKTLRDVPFTGRGDLRWQLNEGAGATAFEARGHADGLFRNMDETAWVDGLSGKALFFDGADDFLAMVGYPGISGDQSRTVSAWIRTQATGTIFFWGQAGVPGKKWLLKVEPQGRLRLEVAQGSIVGVRDLRDNQWHHVAAVLTDNGAVNVEDVILYVDGVAEPISSLTPQVIDTAATVNVKIGITQGGADPFTGIIDEIRIYPDALPPGDIAVLAHLPGDFDNNRILDLNDILQFAANWLTSPCLNPNCQIADITENGDIDLHDYAEFHRPRTPQ